MGLRNSLISLIDNAFDKTEGMLSSVNELVGAFDMNAQLNYFEDRKRALMARGSRFFSNVQSILKNVIESAKDFTVVVQYNKDEDQLDYSFDGNSMTINVQAISDTRQKRACTVVTIPSDCIIDRMTTKCDDKAKTMVFTFPKDIRKNPNFVEIKEHTQEFVNDAMEKATQIADTVANKVKPVEEQEAEQTEETAQAEPTPTVEPQSTPKRTRPKSNKVKVNKVKVKTTKKGNAKVEK